MSGEAEHEIYARRGARNRVVLLVLLGFVVLMFTVTIVRLAENSRHPFKLFWNPSQAASNVEGAANDVPNN